MRYLLQIIICTILLFPLCATQYSLASSPLTEKGYSLEKVLIMSRHNIRSPLSGEGSLPYQMTQNKWYGWTSPPGHLSTHGGVAETIMGQYFRKYLEDEHFMPENWIPDDGEVRFYANSFQRTIATAQYFSSGMLPIANVKIERTRDLDKTDYVFLPHSNLTDDEIKAAIEYDNNLYSGEGISAFGKLHAEDMDKMEYLLDFQQSEYAKKRGIEHIDKSDLSIKLTGENHDKISYKGMVYDFVTVSDALIMQYYENPDNSVAAFGKNFSDEDWKSIGRIISDGHHIHWGNPVIAAKLSRNILREMEQELTDDNRKFTFLCGHDTNIASILTSLGTEEYYLPNTITNKTQIGSKIVIEKRIGSDGVAYANVNLVYASDKQLRNSEMLDLNNPPMSYPLTFKSLKKNSDGLYLFDDVIKLLHQASLQ